MTNIRPLWKLRTSISVACTPGSGRSRSFRTLNNSAAVTTLRRSDDIIGYDVMSLITLFCGRRCVCVLLCLHFTYRAHLRRPCWLLDALLKLCTESSPVNCDIRWHWFGTSFPVCHVTVWLWKSENYLGRLLTYIRDRTAKLAWTLHQMVDTVGLASCRNKSPLYTFWKDSQVEQQSIRSS